MKILRKILCREQKSFNHKNFYLFFLFIFRLFIFVLPKNRALISIVFIKFFYSTVFCVLFLICSNSLFYLFPSYCFLKSKICFKKIVKSRQKSRNARNLKQTKENRFKIFHLNFDQNSVPNRFFQKSNELFKNIEQKSISPCKCHTKDFCFQKVPQNFIDFKLKQNSTKK